MTDPKLLEKIYSQAADRLTIRNFESFAKFHTIFFFVKTTNLFDYIVTMVIIVKNCMGLKKFLVDILIDWN